jgi:hypothetical protein
MEEEVNKRETLKLGLKFVLGLVGLVAVVALLGHHYRGELETLGRALLDQFGYIGIALGTFIADGFHFPIPPQFYMLASIAAGWSAVGTRNHQHQHRHQRLRHPSLRQCQRPHQRPRRSQSSRRPSRKRPP